MSRQRRGKVPEESVSRTRNHQKFSDAIYELYGGKCWLCGKRNADTIDHVVPVAWGGSDHPSNLKPAHRSCNSSKGASKPSRQCWSIPSMWEDGYGPRSASPDDVYPRPQGRTFRVVFLLLISVGLYWMGQRTGIGYLGVAGIGLSAVTIITLYLRWWVWKLTCHRIMARASEDATPEDPAAWFALATLSPPGLKEIGGVQDAR